MTAPTETAKTTSEGHTSLSCPTCGEWPEVDSECPTCRRLYLAQMQLVDELDRRGRGPVDRG